jgi:hypothetical protein
MKEVVTKNNPTPQRLRVRGVDVSKTLFYTGIIVPAGWRAFQSEPPVRSVKC